METAYRSRPVGAGGAEMTLDGVVSASQDVVCRAIARIVWDV